VTGAESVLGKVGQELGVSTWLTVTQDLVDRFAEATGDRYWLHTDVERARSGPFGGTIAHGFLTLSLAGGFLSDAVPLHEFAQVVNYGVEKVRFPAPLRVGDDVRMRATLEDCVEAGNGVTLRIGVVFEARSGGKPPCVATWLLRGTLAG
jgi:acyl dehydratase